MNELFTLFAGYAKIPLLVVFVGLVFCCITQYFKNLLILKMAGALYIVYGTVARFFINGSIYHFLIIVIFVIVILILNSLLVKYLKNKRKCSSLINIQNNIVGMTTFAGSNFNPNGKFMIGGKSYNAISICGIIKEQTKIKVVKILNNKIYVCKVK